MKTRSEPAWQFQYSVECAAPRRFAWSYWTNVANWNDPPATFHLDGPFDVGSTITTNLPDQTLRSVIEKLVADTEAVIEMQLPGACLTFYWKFETISENHTRITQHLALSGPDAYALVAQAIGLEHG